VRGLVLLLAACHDWTALSARHASCAPLAPSSCPDNVALCEGFEGTATGPAWSLATPLDATIAIDDECAYRGKQSEHVHTDAVGAGGSAVAGIYETTVDPTLPQRFVRAFIYVADPAPVNALRLLQVSQNAAPPNMTLAVKLAGTSLSLPGATNGTDAIFPTDRWVCLEWEIGLGAPGTLQLWMDDGADAISVAQDTTQAAPPLSRILVGAGGYSSVVGDEPAHDLWIDEVIIDSERVGCAK
jgi:hypothetical protein